MCGGDMEGKSIVALIREAAKDVASEQRKNGSRFRIFKGVKEGS